MTARWRVELLGEMRVTGANRVIGSFPSRRAALLLAYLSCTLPRTHPRDVLIELLWPGCDSSAGRNRLCNLLSTLRRTLAAVDASADAFLLANRTAIGLNPALVTTDVAQFEREAWRAAETGSRVGRLGCLRAAVSVYRGELLSGLEESWIVAERERLAAAYSHALRQLIALLAEDGDLDQALFYACEGMRIAPEREEIRRELARLQTERPPACAPRSRDSAPRRGHSALPAGTVSLLLMEVPDPSASRRRQPEASLAVPTGFRGRLCALFQECGGALDEESSQAFTVVFLRASESAACALAVHRAWPDAPGQETLGSALPAPRMALDVGEVDLRDGTHRHSMLFRHAERLLLAAHPGQILVSDQTAALLRRDRRPEQLLTPLGTYRLSENSLPEALFQLTSTDRPSALFPPPQAEPAPSGQLPPALTRYFGREAEMTHLCELLTRRRPPPASAPAGPSLVTLTGAGGHGKTRLALELARRLWEEFGGAVWFVPLADATDAVRIPDGIREAMALPRVVTVEPLEQIARVLSARRSLLVLDNFEHLVDDGATTLRILLDRIPTLTCLVTSRRRLNLHGEREFPVLPLPVPEGVMSHASRITLSQCPSVQLFVDRAQAVRPDFQLTAGNAAAVAAVCERLEGIPLALELAAARAQVLTPGQMLAHLEDRFAFLVSRGRDVRPRHRTLRAAIEWSYQLLPSEIREFFARLGIFHSGFTLAAAETVCLEMQNAECRMQNEEGTSVLDRLEQLRECSLVLAEEVPPSSASSHSAFCTLHSAFPEMRFRMLETLREFAREQLAPETLAALATRHAFYYLGFAESADAQLKGPDREEWLDRLTMEHENLRAGFSWSLRNSENRMLAVQYVGALWWFWLVRDHAREVLPSVEEVLARTEQMPEIATAEWKEARARVFRAAGSFCWAKGDLARPYPLLQQSATIWREIGNQRDLAITLAWAAEAALNRRDYTTSRQVAEESVVTARVDGDTWTLAVSLWSLGKAALVSGDMTTARAASAESLTLFQETGDPWGLALPTANLGFLAWDENDLETARSWLEASLSHRRAINAKLAAAHCLDWLGDLALHQGDPLRAEVIFAEGVRQAQEIGLNWRLVSLLNHLAAAKLGRGDSAEACALFRRATALRQEIGAAPGSAAALQHLAEAEAARRRYPQAAHLFAAAAAVREAIGAATWPNDQKRLLDTARAALAEAEGVSSSAAGAVAALRQLLDDRFGGEASDVASPTTSSTLFTRSRA